MRLVTVNDFTVTVAAQTRSWYCHKLTEFEEYDDTKFNPLTGTLRLQSNGNTVIGTVAVDGWAVTFGTARPFPLPSSLYQM